MALRREAVLLRDGSGKVRIYRELHETIPPTQAYISTALEAEILPGNSCIGYDVLAEIWGSCKTSLAEILEHVQSLSLVSIEDTSQTTKHI